jgi:hypothetical protein
VQAARWIPADARRVACLNVRLSVTRPGVSAVLTCVDLSNDAAVADLATTLLIDFVTVSAPPALLAAPAVEHANYTHLRFGRRIPLTPRRASASCCSHSPGRERRAARPRESR